MASTSGTPSIWLVFDERGLVDASAASQLVALLNRQGVEDLVVMSHGWQGDKNSATKLYETLWAKACANFEPGKAERIVVAGVLWPAKAFSTDFDQAALAPGRRRRHASGDRRRRGRHRSSEQEFETLLKEFESFVGPAGAATAEAARTAAKGLTTSVIGGTRAARRGRSQHRRQIARLRACRDAAPIARATKQSTEAQMLLANLVGPPS